MGQDNEGRRRKVRVRGWRVNQKRKLHNRNTYILKHTQYNSRTDRPQFALEYFRIVANTSACCVSKFLSKGGGGAWWTIGPQCVIKFYPLNYYFFRSLLTLHSLRNLSHDPSPVTRPSRTLPRFSSLYPSRYPSLTSLTRTGSGTKRRASSRGKKFAPLSMESCFQTNPSCSIEAWFVSCLHCREMAVAADWEPSQSSPFHALGVREFRPYSN